MIDRLLAKEPADRFQSAAEVADLLERGLAHVQQPTAVPRPEVPGVVPHRTLALASPQLEFDLPVAKAPRRPRRRLAMAAGLLLLGLAGLGVSEAAGLTEVSEFVATILRIKTPEGTLVVKVDDPGVKVDVDNEVVIIGGAGPQEIRLRTGLHRVQATRNGQPVRDELVSIMKGKKEIVTIGFEAEKAGTVGILSPTPVTTPPMTAPPSHVQQCMACHAASDALNRPLPANHPGLGLPRRATGAMGTDRKPGPGRGCGPTARPGVERRLQPPTAAGWPSASRASTAGPRPCGSGTWPTRKT